MRVVLLDFGLQFHSRQAHVLALAGLLQNTPGLEVEVGCFGKSALAPRLDAEGIPVFTFPGSGVGNPLMLYKLWNWLKTTHMDMLHAFGGNAVYACEKCLRHLKFKPHMMVSLDSLPAEEDEKPLSRACLLGSPPFEGLSMVLCPSVGGINRLVADGIPRTLLLSLPPGIRENAIQRRTPRADGRFVFLAAAPLCPESGLLSLIEALPLLRDRDDVPPWEVRIVGAGNEFEPLLERARQLKVDAWISLLGKQDPEEQLPLCDVAVTTNLDSTDRNFFILQAWHAHVPLICSSVPSTVEILGDERNALLFIPGNSAALASAMLRCMIDPNLYQRLLKTGQSEFARHTVNAVSEEILRLYKHVLPL